MNWRHLQPGVIKSLSDKNLSASGPKAILTKCCLAHGWREEGCPQLENIIYIWNVSSARRTYKNMQIFFTVHGLCTPRTVESVYSMLSMKTISEAQHNAITFCETSLSYHKKKNWPHVVIHPDSEFPTASGRFKFNKLLESKSEICTTTNKNHFNSKTKTFCLAVVEALLNSMNSLKKFKEVASSISCYLSN